MYLEIFKDYVNGFYDSIRISQLIKPITSDIYIRNCIWKIAKINFLMHFMPFLIFTLLQYFFSISLATILNFLTYPINLFSILFNIFHYIDLIGMIYKYSPPMPNTNGTIDLLALAITMSIYQLVIYLSTTLVHYVVPNQLYYVSMTLNFIILAIYHSFYCFNSLWQYQQISMNYRIDIHEKLWPYYIGYGTIATFLYWYSDHPIILGCYNIYLVMMITLPFLLKPRYPRTKMPYPAINMSIFSYIMGLILSLTK